MTDSLPSPQVQQRLPLPTQNTFVDWMDAVSRFWKEADYKTCERCIYFDGPGYCEILHARVVPDGECLGVIETIGMKQP